MTLQESGTDAQNAVRALEPVDARCTQLVANGKHNAFPSICKWAGAYWIAYRAGISHGEGAARVVVMKSVDTQTWTIAFEIDAGYDNRDPQLIGDGERMLVYWALVGEDGRVRTLAAQTTDGRGIGPVSQVHGDGFVLWRPIKHGGRFYSASYRGGGIHERQVDLVGSDDGLTWRWISTLGAAPGRWSETVIGIGEEDRMTAYVRLKYSPSKSGPCLAQVWTSAYPYTRWEQTGELAFRIEGPGLCEVAGETYLITRAFNALGSANALNIHLMRGGSPVLYCAIPCMRDSAYGHAVEHEGQMLVVFYCTAPDGVNLYLARIALPGPEWGAGTMTEESQGDTRGRTPSPQACP